jgi:hypothetical protein
LDKNYFPGGSESEMSSLEDEIEVEEAAGKGKVFGYGDNARLPQVFSCDRVEVQRTPDLVGEWSLEFFLT